MSEVSTIDRQSPDPAFQSEVGEGGGAPILRVLLGRSAGAEHTLPRGRSLTIGHSFDNDVVLRGKSTQGCAIKLVIASDYRMMVEIVAGTACILGRELCPGEKMDLTSYLPIMMGDFVFAVGGSSSQRWADAARDAQNAQSPSFDIASIPQTDLAERVVLRSQPARRSLEAITQRPAMIAIIGAALLVATAGALYGPGLIYPPKDTPVSLGSALVTAGYRGLEVKRGPDGAMAVTGLVTDDASLSRLRAWIARNAPDARIGVQTIDGMAAAAGDLLAAQNIAGRARPTGASGLIVEGPFLPTDRKRELISLIRRDLPLVRNVQFRVTGDHGGQELAYFFNSPGYGAVSFVDGNPGHITTEDGSRWFEGAQLPTGHRILKVGQGRVTVERDGFQDTLIM